MSYILEALKKAQAERQLGSAPTIHAPSAVHATPVSAASRRPLLIGVAAGAVLAAAAVIVAWRHQTPAPVVLASTQAASGAGNAAPVPQAEVAVAGKPAVVARSVASTPAAPVASPSVPAAGAAITSKPAKSVRVPVAGKAVRAPEAAVANGAVPVSPVPPVRAPAPTPVVEKPAAPAADDNVRTLAELPAAIQREVPRVAFGGYIYSPNPADRLLLVDKALRHEGEEVAPGLVLEKLLPKAAVMNFRGYRYRVAY